VEGGLAKDYYQFSKRTFEMMVGYKRRIGDRLIVEIGYLNNLFNFDNSPDMGIHLGLTVFLPRS
jgi:hypothetical protein